MSTRAIISAVLPCILLAGCGRTELSGEPDSSADPIMADPVAEDPRTEDAAEPEPSCWDHDEDGHQDVACGGDDCDDSRSDVYPRASEVCLDGVDQDCDGFVDGVLVLSDVLTVASELERGVNGTLRVELAWTGSEFITVWNDETGTRHPHIYMSRISPDGTSSTDKILVSGTEGAAWAPGLAWTGSQLGISWKPGGGFVSIALFAPDGSRVGAEHQLGAEDMFVAGPPRIVWTGSEFGVVWEGILDRYLHIYFQRADASGAKIGEYIVVSSLDPDDVSEGSVDPDIVWTGSEYGITWVYAESMFSVDELYLARLSADGIELGDDIKQLETYALMTPRIVNTASGFAIAYRQSSDAYLLRTSPTGLPYPDPLRITTSMGSYGCCPYPDVVWDGSGHAVVWSDDRDWGMITGSDAYVNRYTVDGLSAGLDLRLTEQTGETNRPRAVWTGSELGVAWEDKAWEETGWSLLFVRIGFCE